MPYSGARIEGKDRDTRYNDLARHPAGGAANDPRTPRYRAGEGNAAKATYDRETAAAQNDEQRAAAKNKYDAAVTVDVTTERRAAAKVVFDRDTAAAQNDEQRAAAKTVYDRALVA
jgi:hypothetical protein